MNTFTMNTQTEELDPRLFEGGFDIATEAEAFEELELQARQDGSVTLPPM